MDLANRITLLFTTIARTDSARRLVETARQHYPWLAICAAEQGPEDGAFEAFCMQNGVRHLRLAYDVGLPAARNALVRAIGTDYFILADDDFELDASIPFESAVRFLDAHPGFLCVGGELDDFLEKDGVLAPVPNRGRAANLLLDRAGGGVIRIPVGLLGTKEVTFEGRLFNLCDYVANWAVYRRGAIVDHGFWWDERFRVGGEHIDFFLRAKLHDPPLRVALLPALTCRHVRRQSGRYAELRARTEWMALFREKWSLRYLHELGGPVRWLADGSLTQLDSHDARRLAAVTRRNEALEESNRKLKDSIGASRLAYEKLAEANAKLREQVNSLKAHVENSRKRQSG